MRKQWEMENDMKKALDEQVNNIKQGKALNRHEEQILSLRIQQETI